MQSLNPWSWFWCLFLFHAGATIAACPVLVGNLLAPDSTQSFAFLLFGFALSEMWRAPAAIMIRDVSPPNLGSTGSAVHLCIRNLIGGLGPVSKSFDLSHACSIIVQSTSSSVGFPLVLGCLFFQVLPTMLLWDKLHRFKVHAYQVLCVCICYLSSYSAKQETPSFHLIIPLEQACICRALKCVMGIVTTNHVRSGSSKSHVAQQSHALLLRSGRKLTVQFSSLI